MSSVEATPETGNFQWARWRLDFDKVGVRRGARVSWFVGWSWSWGGPAETAFHWGKFPRFRRS